MLEIKNLHVSVDGKEILKGISLNINSGEIHALMGPNGSGKSTLSAVLMGHPKYTVESGEIILNGKNVLAMQPNDRFKTGIFLAMQYPMEIPGVVLNTFLWTLYKNRNPDKSVFDYKEELKKSLGILSLEKSVTERYLNVGFSGGEKKRAEVLQLLLAKPEFAILDETDSGLDIDSLKIVANGVNTMRGPRFSDLVITHYQRILSYLKPDFVHVLIEGKIVKSGGPELVHELEQRGYGWLMPAPIAQ